MRFHLLSLTHPKEDVTLFELLRIGRFYLFSLEVGRNKKGFELVIKS